MNNSNSPVVDPDTTLTFEDVYKFYSAWSFDNLTPVRNVSRTLPSMSIILRDNPLYPQGLFITDSLLFPLPVVGSAKNCLIKTYELCSSNNFSRNLKNLSKSYYPNHTLERVFKIIFSFQRIFPCCAFPPFFLSSYHSHRHIFFKSSCQHCYVTHSSEKKDRFLSLLLRHLPLKHIKMHKLFSIRIEFCSVSLCIATVSSLSPLKTGTILLPYV